MNEVAVVPPAGAPVKLDGGQPGALAPKTTGNMVQATDAATKVIVAMQAAKAFPRNELACLDRMKISCSRKGLAATAIYSYTRGGSSVEGPSVRLLEMAASIWGNIKHGYHIIEQGADYTKIEAYCIDLETNAEVTREETIKHYRKSGGRQRLLTDERDIREFVASWAARAERTCMEHVIPRDIIEECMEACNQTLAADSKNTDPEKIKALVAAFAEYKVTVPMIETKIGRHIDAIQAQHVVLLRKIYAGLKDGYTTIEQAFPQSVQQQPAAAGGGEKPANAGTPGSDGAGAAATTGDAGANGKPLTEAEKIAKAYGLGTGKTLKQPAAGGEKPAGEGAAAPAGEAGAEAK